MGSARYPLSENFLRFFDVHYASTEELKSEAYGIRYRVYCEEFGYEPVEAFPDQQERDEFDAHSLHALVSHKSSGLSAGCVRMVSPVASAAELPFEKNCDDSLDKEMIAELGLERASVCEISRLAVDNTFRRRVGEEVTRFGEVEGLDCSQQERRTFSMIAVTCFLAATALTEVSGRTDVFALMEPFLPRLLKRSGIDFQRVGRDIDYHGLRAPYFIRTQSALDNMRPDLKELYMEVRKRIHQGYNA